MMAEMTFQEMRREERRLWHQYDELLRQENIDTPAIASCLCAWERIATELNRANMKDAALFLARRSRVPRESLGDVPFLDESVDVR